jgi:transcriptional regulator with XRE-family HTH domain
MPLYCAGKVIQEFRKRQHMLQDELCCGLCEPSTLSKIESCRQNPTKKLFEALMSRLGVSVGIFNIAVTETEYERGEIECEIVSKLADSGYEIEELLEKYKNCGQTMDKLEKQFYLFAAAVCGKEHGMPDEQVFYRLIEAIQQTFPGYSADTDISSRFLTVFELMILNGIAVCLHDGGRYEQAVRLLSSVKKYFETHNIDREEYAKQYPVVVYNLSSWLAWKKEYEPALEAAVRGIDCCSAYGKLSFFPVLVYNKGYALAGMGNKTEGRRCMVQAVTILTAMNANSRIAELKKDADKSFGSDFLIIPKK